MNPRLQQTIATGLIAAVGVWVCFISYTQQPQEAFLFPRLIASVFVALALWTFGRALLGLSSSAGNQGLSLALLKNLLPGLVVSGLYIFWLAKALGFYTATAIAVFALLSIYDPAPHNKPTSWVKRLLISAGFIGIMYALFALLLQVYTPRETLF